MIHDNLNESCGCGVPKPESMKYGQGRNCRIYLTRKPSIWSVGSNHLTARKDGPHMPRAKEDTSFFPSGKTVPLQVQGHPNGALALSFSLTRLVVWPSRLTDGAVCERYVPNPKSRRLKGSHTGVDLFRFIPFNFLATHLSPSGLVPAFQVGQRGSIPLRCIEVI